jgi:hypothetical protein
VLRLSNGQVSDAILFGPATVSSSLRQV